MKILYGFMFVMLFFVLLGVAWLNQTEQVAFNVFGTTYNLKVWALVLGSTAFGAGTLGILALVEGASVRLTNRRLNREIRQLETELNYLRTQPPAVSVPDVPPANDSTEGKGQPAALPASAPNYGAEGAWNDDESDDVYSGERGV